MLHKPLCALQQGWENWQWGDGVGPAELGAVTELCSPTAPCKVQVVFGDAGQSIICLPSSPLYGGVLPGRASVSPPAKWSCFADGSVSCCTPKLSCAGKGGHSLWDVNIQGPAMVMLCCCAAPGLPECLQTWRSRPLPAQRCGATCPCMQAAISCCGEPTF